MVTSHFVKPYRSEPAVISLTSWKARIATVGLTLYSIFKNCPGFHVVLVLSEEEFPKKEAELPKELIMMCKKGLLEILWIVPNIKAMKKVLPTMTVYRDVPIISADDDCIYVCNYAKQLYNKWLCNQLCFIRYNCTDDDWRGLQGPCSLYIPQFAKYITMNDIINVRHYMTDDDIFFQNIISRNHLSILTLTNTNPYVFHTTVGALNPSQYAD